MAPRKQPLVGVVMGSDSDWETMESDPAGGEVVTKRPPTEQERASLGFAWKVCQAVKSNAIVLASGRQLLGVGAGQMSRLDSVRIAVEKAGERARGAVLASDAWPALTWRASGGVTRSR